MNIMQEGMIRRMQQGAKRRESVLIAGCFAVAALVVLLGGMAALELMR